MKDLKKKRQKLIESMPPWEEIIRGTVCEYYLPCGKEKCRCKEKKEYRHGPYYYLSFGESGKTSMQLLPKDIKEKVFYYVKQYEKLWKILCEISKINLKLLLAIKERSKKTR